jgi:hypothetical protein
MTIPPPADASRPPSPAPVEDLSVTKRRRPTAEVDERVAQQAQLVGDDAGDARTLGRRARASAPGRSRSTRAARTRPRRPRRRGGRAIEHAHLGSLERIALGDREHVPADARWPAAQPPGRHEPQHLLRCRERAQGGPNSAAHLGDPLAANEPRHSALEQRRSTLEEPAHRGDRRVAFRSTLTARVGERGDSSANVGIGSTPADAQGRDLVGVSSAMGRGSPATRARVGSCATTSTPSRVDVQVRLEVAAAPSRRRRRTRHSVFSTSLATTPVRDRPHDLRMRLHEVGMRIGHGCSGRGSQACRSAACGSVGAETRRGCWLRS